ncbi:ATP-binding cassette sub-family A member 13 [Heterocephalus glaber]|uniref:ATP-binding cassette sub-family A member 13 n=1 Tax=Heterocephalus glaber TaxID=10181 RepID=A0AAX6SL24_HETGA|nr:ATP-binding cassette sub-family A member 13 [Heterocephalus glaber]
MGLAGRQFQALVWKNGLCRLRHPVLSLAEFCWPCILFTILTVLRFQEPPRHRDSCFLQPRDLPSRGILPFVQGLLCNTGSTCRNFSFEGYMDHHFRFQTAAADTAVTSLGFVEEVQGLAEDIYEMMNKAKHLQKLWGERGQTPDSSYGSSFLTMDLNQTEDMLSELEILHQQPYLWDFLHSLPRLQTNRVLVGDTTQTAVYFLQAVLNSVASLDHLDWLPLNPTLSQVSTVLLNSTISALTFLQQPGGAATESVYHLSLQNMVWDPQKVQRDLQSQFGFNGLQTERLLNYSVELQEVFGQWQQGGLLQKVLTGTARSVQALQDRFEQGGMPWKVAEALRVGLLLLSDALAVDGPRDSHSSSQIFQHLQTLQNVLHKLPRWPALERLRQLDGALRNVISQDLHFVQEILTHLETLANDSVLGGPDRWKLEKNVFFGGLKQLLMKNATVAYLNGCLSEEAPKFPGNSSVWGDPWGLLCHHTSFNKTRVFNRLLGAVEDADHGLQEAIAGHTDILVSDPEVHPGWQELKKQLLKVNHSCSGLFQLLGADASPGTSVSAGGCEQQLVSTIIFHILEKAQLSLGQMSYWKSFPEFIRKTCEMARYVNTQGSFQNNLSALSEDSPCYAENMDWKIISDNYFAFLNNLLTSPITSTSRAFNSTKYLLVMEKKWHAHDDEELNFLLSFVEFLEKLLLPNPFESSSAHEFHNLPSLIENFLNASVLWVNYLKSLGRNSSTVDAQKLLEFGQMVIEKMQTHESHWMKKAYQNALRVMELILFKINPKLLELWHYGVSEGERAKLETLSTFLNFSVPENEKILSKNFNFSQLFHSDWPESPPVNMDFVHLSKTIISSLYEFGFLTQGEISEALDAVYAIRNASGLFLALSELQKQEIDKILTHVYLHVFKDKDSALLLQIYSSFYQYIYKFLSLQNREPLLTYLTQISRHILDIVKQFNFQDIRKAFASLSGTAGALGGISEESYCQQLLSLFNFLELQAQSLMSTEDQELEVIHATLTGLKQLLIVDEDFRVSLFQYMSQLFNGSGDGLWGSDCFVLDNKTISSANRSTFEGPSLILPWAQIFSTLSPNVSEFTAIHCTVSWLQMWTEIWESISHIFKFEKNVFTSLHVGLTELLGELENDMKISKSCQGLLPTHHAARLILNLFKNVTCADGLHIGDGFLDVRDLWVALGDALVTVKSLNLEQVERSLSTMEAALHQLKTFPLDTNTSREFLYSLLDVFSELSNTSEYLGRNAELINHFLSNNLTHYGTKFERVITEFRETISLLRHLSHNGDLLSCAGVFQNVTELILEGGLLHANASQRMVHILAVLNSTFSSENTVSSLRGCVGWVDVINHLYSMCNSSFSQGLFPNIFGSFPDIENKMNATLKIVTWALNRMKPLCSLNEPNINCVNIYLKDMTDFLNTIFTTVFEKEKVPKFEILLALLNDSTNQVRMIIKNLTRAFDSASQSNWKNLLGLFLRPIEVSDEIPNPFQNVWLHLIALGKEIQKLMQDISPIILENIPSTTEKVLSIFATIIKEKDINHLGKSVYHFANHFALILSHRLQNSSEIVPNEIRTAVGLGIQLVRDVFNSLMPTVQHSIPEGTRHVQVLKQVSPLMRSLRRADIDLLVEQLEQISEGLVDFFRNLSRLGTDDVGVDLLVGLMEKLTDSSSSWNVHLLLRLSRLFPREDVNLVVHVYHALPHVARLLERVADKNLTEGLKDIHDFMLLHGISIANISKEDFAIVIKTLLDTIEQISDQPALVPEALTCLPVLWCRTHAAPGFLQNPELAGCGVQGRMSSSFYGKVASILDRLHLSHPGEHSQCSKESSRMEMSRKAVCVIHELADWNSILLELSEVFHLKTSLLKTVQEFWDKVLPFVPPSGNQSHGSSPEFCAGGPIKQVALQIIEHLTKVNFTKVTSGKNILDKVVRLNKILKIVEGTQTAVENNISLHLERMIKSISGHWNLENRTHYPLSPFMSLPIANHTGNSLEALASFLKLSEVTDNFEELWLDFKQTMENLTHAINIRHLLSETNKEIQSINSVALQNTTLPLSYFLEILNSSSLKMLEAIEAFLLVTKNWLHEYAKEDYSRLIQTLFVPASNESSSDNMTVLIKDIVTFLDYLKNISRENNFDVAFLSPLLHGEQLVNFSLIQWVLENILINSINNRAGRSQEAGLSLNDADLHITNLINLTLNHTWSGKGGKTVLSPRQTVDFVDQLLKTFLSLLLKENSDNKISLLLKDLHEESAGMSSVFMDKLLEALKLDQFLTWRSEDRWMSVFSSLEEAVFHLVRSSFWTDGGELSFDSPGGLEFMCDAVLGLLREASEENKPAGGQDFPGRVSQVLLHVNSSADLVQLHRDLRSVVYLVRESSAEMANLVNTLLTSPDDFHNLYPVLQEVILANLTVLLSFANNSFPLRNREALEITKMLLSVISGTGAEDHVVEPLVEISRTLATLLDDSAGLKELATTVDSFVKLLQLAKKASEKMTTILETHFISHSKESSKFFDTLYFSMQQRVQRLVKEIATFEKDHFVLKNINDLLLPFLDLVFGMTGVKPSVSWDSDNSSLSSSLLADVSQSKDFTEILEEMAQFLTSVKFNLGDLERLVVALNNGTQIFSMDSVNVWEEILGCLVPINYITKQINFLHSNPLSTHSGAQDTKWERIDEMIPCLDKMLTENSTEMGASMKMLIDLIVDTFWDSLKKSPGDVLNLLLTAGQLPRDLLETIATVLEASHGARSDGGADLRKALFFNVSLIQNITDHQLEKAIQIMLPRIALLSLLPNNSQWINSLRTLLWPVSEIFINAATRKNVTSAQEARTRSETMSFPYSFHPSSSFKKYLKRLIVLIENWQKVLLTDESVVELCQAFQQLEAPSEAMATLQRVELVVLRGLTILAESPSLTKETLCAALSCRRGGVQRLILPALRWATLLHGLYQETHKMWSSPGQLSCESFSKNLSSTLGSFKSDLENATEQGCLCQPPLRMVQRRLHELAKSLGETWLSKNPGMAFLSDFAIPEDVKVRDLMKNITRLTEELQSSVHISDETVRSILEANISRSKVLPSALTVALSGKCDQELLHLLLTFPKDEQSRLATRELCGLPGSKVFLLIVVLSQNLDLRALVYKTLIPSEVSGLLSSLLDVVSSLSSLLSKAQHVLRHLPAFLHAFKINSLLDMADFEQASRHGQARSSAFGSFQSMMSLLCKDQASFLSSSNTFLNLPSVNELLEDDKEKFNIPEDSTPFCLKLYQEILQSPNGALVWSFLKPILHGQILYAPDIPAINKVIQKANYTFYFVDKLKALSETLLKMSSLFQGGGNGQMISQLQEALRNKFIRNFVESQLHLEVDRLMEELQSYGGMLDKVFNRSGPGYFHFLGSALVNLSSCVLLDRFQAMESVDILELEAQKLMQKNKFLASIIFNSSSVGRSFGSASLRLLPHVTYTIRTSILYSMRTDLVKNPSWKFHPQSLPADGFRYNYIFVPLQDMIERAIVAVQTGQEALEPTTQAQAGPYPCHTSDLFLNNVGFFLPLIMMLTWMVSVASMVRKLVYEREIQLEEYLRMMGVHPAIYFLAWFLENMAMLSLSSATVALILKTSGIFAHSNAFVIFLFLLDFGVSAVMLSYFLSVFFSQANTAALCTSLAYLISFLPYIVLLVLNSQLSSASQMFLCLLSTTAFGQGVFFITFLEGQEAGIQWNNMYQAPEPGSMTFGWVCWMILFDSSLYFLCGWYLSNLIPGAFGLRKPWYFPLTASYWKSMCGLVEKQQLSLSSSMFFVNEDFGKKGSSQQSRGGELEGGPLGVSLVSVTKKYEGHKVAVQDLTLTFYRGQITALLGTNGAGKTTVISMLTGLYPPTSGTILINGRNLQTDLSSIRAELGVCPQQDVLLDNLTIQEHLQLFAAIKAPQWTKKERQQQVNKTLEDVGLTQHQHKQTQALSGGTRRKLSIAIAFLGQSSIVVLDEPTSGVDPCSRRSLWDILLKYREGRTIIFTTHHLDEAELLSDRMAILQQGRLRCCGSPVCLKEMYGQGLSLTLAKQLSSPEADDPKYTAHLTALIQVYIPQAVLRGRSGHQLTYAIPQDVDEACFKGLFQALDQNLQPLQLTGYRVSAPTLEEVFLMLLEDSNKKSHIAPGTKSEPQTQRPAGPSPNSCGCPAGTSPQPTLPASGHQLLLAQMAALLRKRLLRTRRAWKNTACDLLLPVLFMALAMGLFMVRPLATDYPPLQMTPGHYERAETYFFSSGTAGMDLTHVLLRKFGDQDPPCADPNPDLMKSSCWRRDPFSPSEFQDSCGCLQCPNRSAGAPYLTNHLGHTLFNLSEFPVEQDLLVPSEKPSLGGWSFGVRVPSEVQDMNANTSKPRTLAKVWYNQKSFHSLPSYLNHLNNLILWRHLPPAVDWRQYGITLYSRPYGGALLNEDKILESIRQCGVALCIVLGFSILSASVGSNVVRDRVTGAKRLQHISGLGYRTYWVTHFLYDMLFYLVSSCLCVSVIAAFQLTAFTFRENLAATALLLALFGYASLPWMYLMSGIFSSSDVAFISYISLNFIFGLCTLLMTTMPRLLAIVSKAQNLQNIYDVLKWVFTIFPQFCLGQGLIELCYNQIRYDLTHNFGIDSYVSPFEMHLLGWIFVELALQGTVLLLLRVLLHRDLLRWAGTHSAVRGTIKHPKDVDVEKEQRRVFEGRTGGDILVLCNLSKSYRSFFRKTTAVRDISLGIPRGECFGLLGVNGAGKSTTFKMLNGDISPSSGHAVVRSPMGADVSLTSAGQAGVLIGYCPQRDALDELLTAREHLRYYCSLRGIPSELIPQVAAELVRRLHLEAHADKLVATYSGGTKRKLSTALALVGKPDILLLDEPSSGMDPCSKRYLWQTILKEVQEGCAAVLTSHSMEECEALCSRLAIMVDGSFRCLGSPQHIRDRFGDGFILKVWLYKEENQPSTISDCLKLNFPGVQFKGQRLNLLEYYVPKRWGCLADLFKVLENNKNFLNIEHYSINQTTLEEVFVNFGTEQEQTPPSPLDLPTEVHCPCHLPV